MCPNSQKALRATSREGLDTRLPDSFCLNALKDLGALKSLPGKSQC
jgi:hypothetical protein